MRRVFSAFCIVFLLASIMMPLSAIAAPDMQRSQNRSVDPARDYVAAYSANLTSTQSNSGTVLCTVPAGYRVRDVLSSNSGWYYSTNAWRNVTYNSYTGYIKNSLLIPANKSYSMIVQANMMSGVGNGYVVATLPKYTRIYSGSSTTYNGPLNTLWKYVSAYTSSGYKTGYVQVGYFSVDYGYGN